MTLGEACFFDRPFNFFAGFASALLNPIKQFVVPTLSKLKIIIREHGPS